MIIEMVMELQDLRSSAARKDELEFLGVAWETGEGGGVWLEEVVVSLLLPVEWLKPFWLFWLGRVDKASFKEPNLFKFFLRWGDIME